MRHRGPLVLDEPIDRVFSRPLGRIVAILLRRTAASPNHVTCVAATCGILAGVGLHVASPGLTIFGLLGFLIFDCADGELARMRPSGGYFGRAVDGLGDVIAAVAIHSGLVAAIARHYDSLGLGLVLGIGAGLSLAWSSAMLDRYKRRYGGKSDNLRELDTELAAATGFREWLLTQFRRYAFKLQDDEVKVPELVPYQMATREPMMMFLVNGPSMHYLVLAFFAYIDKPYQYAWLCIVLGTVATFLTLRVQDKTETFVVKKPGAPEWVMQGGEGDTSAAEGEETDPQGTSIDPASQRLELF